MLHQISDDEFQVLPEGNHKTIVQNASITDLEDGGAVIEYDGPAPINHDSPHYENLAAEDRMPDQVLSALGSYLTEAIEDDISSRSEWDNSLKNGIDQLGINVQQNVTYPFKNATGVYSPAFMQAQLSSVSNITAELLPPNGPLKVNIVGDEDEDTLDRADRVEKFLNLYLTQICKDFYPDMEQAFMWCVLEGSVFTKTYFDPVLKRPICQYIKPQDLVVNYNESSLARCNRITHVLNLTTKELKQRQYVGLYDEDVEVTADYTDDNISSVDEKVARTEGVTPGDEQYNQMYTLYECHVDLDLEGFEHKDNKGNKTGIPLPYIVTIDANTQRVMSIYRNWEENDEDCRRIEYFTHFPFFPGLGFYAYGLVHIAGGSAKAATSILRQLIDAGVLSNFPGGFHAKGVNLPDNTVRIGPGEYRELEVSGVGSIQDAVMPLPFKEPSQTLLQLKNDIETGIGNIVNAAESQFADFNPNAPVGTTLALLEQANKLQSSVMRRLHRSMGEVFQILYRLFSEYATEAKYPYTIHGHKNKVMKSDFKEDLTLVPVSDPNITSSAQRLLRNEAAYNLAKDNPEIINKRELIKEMFRDMKISNIDAIMIPEDEDPPALDPITENEYLLNKQPVKAYIFQDQDAYISTKMPILLDPNTDPEVLEAVKANVAQRTAFKYRLTLQKMTGIELPENLEELTPEQQNKIALKTAKASQKLVEQIQAQLQTQEPQADAAMVEAQAMMIEAQAKDKEVELRAQIDMQKIENERLKLQLEQLKLDQKTETDAIKLQIEEMKIMQTGKNEEQKAETSAFEAQLRYETEQDKIEMQKEQMHQKPVLETSTM